MAKIKYDLHLKGYVGGWNFDADYIDWVLEKNKDKEVNILIDSLGGRADTALSIYAAFKRHGNVNVHFVGMNASAATIASMGAKRITMDASAMYLVHKCNISFFKWAVLNSDDLQKLQESITKEKKNLDKLDSNVAEIYAKKCKKTSQALLDLMKEGGWLTSKEALEWGFVDEVTEYQEDEAPVIDNLTAQVMASEGIPMPKGLKSQGAWSKFRCALTEIFYPSQNTNLKSQTSNLNSHKMDKKYVNVCDILKCDTLSVEEEEVTLSEAQVDSIESAISEDRKTIQSLNDRITALESEKAKLQSQIDNLKKKPAEESHQVVSEKKEEPSEMESFVSARQAAADLFNMFD